MYQNILLLFKHGISGLLIRFFTSKVESHKDEKRMLKTKIFVTLQGA